MELNRIQQVLTEEGKSQKWLASELGTSTVTVNMWCKNRSQPPLKKSYRIAQLIQTSPSKLLVE
jgi:DNA-binding XRE family transcriptional regulator